MLDFFPDFDKQEINPEVYKITIRHLLTMSDGLAKYDMALYLSDNDLSQVLRQEPGTGFFYNCLSPQVLSMIITRSIGMNALDFGMKNLFGPLGISEVKWQEIDGSSVGCHGISLASRDMAKIGYLFLNKGLWEGKQLIASDWILESTKTQIMVPRTQNYIDTTGKYYLDHYGFFWWIRPLAEHSAYIAWGYGGQLIYVIPDLDCVVIITTNDSDRPSNMYAHIYLSIIDDYLVPAMTGP